MNEGRWNLDVLYTGFDSDKFKSDMARLEAVNGLLAEEAKRLGSRSPKENLMAIVPLLEERRLLSGALSDYCLFRQTADTSDGDAASANGRVNMLSGAAAKAMSEITRYIASIDDLDEAIAGEPGLARYKNYFRREKQKGQHLLTGDGEDVTAMYDVSGGKAWEELHSYETSGATEELNGESLSLTELRNLACDHDGAVRKAAYEAELKCYEKIKGPVAFALNSIKLQSISECRLRGFESVLDKSLFMADMRRETLDALWGAIDEYLPVFHSYYKAKGGALGYKNGLPWYEMFAPMGSSKRTFTIGQTREYIVNVFSSFDGELADTANRAFAESWIDVYPRKGKVGGAYCEPTFGAGQFRILTNFGGMFGDVITLAHELGHGFHEMLVKDNGVLNRDYSMPVAETASTFNENLLVSYAIDHAESDDEKLMLIENRLQDAAQIICDIYSRFLFEKEVCDRRGESFMLPDELCDIMRTAQKKAYGTGLDQSTLNPYMWACKSHYYSSSLGFYNYPYAFGGLLARGLYEMYLKEGTEFLPKYKAMLRETPALSVEDSAKICGIDVSCRDFWRGSLEAFKKDIELFRRLVK